jgi:hypothetical protein
MRYWGHPASYPLDSGVLSLGLKRTAQLSSPSGGEFSNEKSFAIMPSTLRLHGKGIGSRIVHPMDTSQKRDCLCQLALSSS